MMEIPIPLKSIPMMYLEAWISLLFTDSWMAAGVVCDLVDSLLISIESVSFRLLLLLYMFCEDVEDEPMNIVEPYTLLLPEPPEEWRLLDDVLLRTMVPIPPMLEGPPNTFWMAGFLFLFAWVLSLMNMIFVNPSALTSMSMEWIVPVLPCHSIGVNFLNLSIPNISLTLVWAIDRFSFFLTFKGSLQA